MQEMVMPHPYRARPLESEPAMVPLRSLTAERRNACCGEAVCPRETIERLLFDPDPVPLVEAVRLALERDVPLHFIDIDLDDYPLHDEPLPDSYAVQRIGLAPYYREFAAAFAPVVPDREDLRREKGMAWHLQQLSAKHGRVLLVCGMYHLGRIREFFQDPQGEPLARVKRENVRLFNLHPASCREVLGEFPFVNAVYEQRRGEFPPEPAGEGPSLRKRFHALELIAGGKRDIPEAEALTLSIARSVRLVGCLGEMPDRQRIILRLFLESARHYKQETGEPVRVWQKRAFFRFARNCALLDGLLLPDLYHLLSAARGCVDDNFAHAFCRLATFYPWQKEVSDLPTISLDLADLWRQSRRIRFRPKERRHGKGLSRLAFQYFVHISHSQNDELVRMQIFQSDPLYVIDRHSLDLRAICVPKSGFAPGEFIRGKCFGNRRSRGKISRKDLDGLHACGTAGGAGEEDSDRDHRPGDEEEPLKPFHPDIFIPAGVPYDQ